MRKVSRVKNIVWHGVARERGSSWTKKNLFGHSSFPLSSASTDLHLRFSAPSPLLEREKAGYSFSAKKKIVMGSIIANGSLWSPHFPPLLSSPYIHTLFSAYLNPNQIELPCYLFTLFSPFLPCQVRTYCNGLRRRKRTKADLKLGLGIAQDYSDLKKLLQVSLERARGGKNLTNVSASA